MRTLLNLSKLNEPSKHKNQLIFTICLREKQADSFSLPFKKKTRQKNEASNLALGSK